MTAASLGPKWLPLLVQPLLLLTLTAWIVQSGLSDPTADTSVLKVGMPGAMPTQDDSYLCSSTRVPDNGGQELHIVGYRPISDMSVAHHVLLYGCREPLVTNPEKVYDCGSICRSPDAHILYAWARNAPELQLPKDTGFVIGGRTSIQYVIIQVHYLHAQTQPDRSAVELRLSRLPQPFSAGIFLLLAFRGSIPPGSQHASLDVSCKYSGGAEIRPFAFRTHAHALSKAIVGYRLSSDMHNVQEIGRASPQWAQAFYPARPGVVVRDGDYLAARCVYDSTGETVAHRIGSTHNDEMCNFYIMFATPADSKLRGAVECGGGGPGVSPAARRLWRKIPQDSLDYLPDKMPTDAFAYATTASAPRKGVSHPPPTPHQVAVVPDWPRMGDRRLGQVSGVAAGLDGRVFVFQRGDRVWGPGAFRPDNRLSDALISEGAIAEDTVLELNAGGGVASGWGRGLFYMPHSLHVDAHGNFWITDVGLHQVLKFSPDHKQLLAVGVKLTPSSGRSGFCQPADAVTNAAGDVFVADGYCNKRVVMLTPDGDFKREFVSAEGSLEVPHSLALIEAERLVCVADRERARIECWNWDSGRSERRFASPQFGESIYAVAYSPTARQLYAISGGGRGFTLDPASGAVLQAWGHFTRPHAMALAAGGAALLVAEIQVPGRLWKFSVSGLAAQSDVPGRFAGQRTASAAAAGPHSHSLVLVRDSQASLLIALLLALPVGALLLALALLKLRRSRGGGRSGPGKSLLGGGGGGFRDREGFQPLTQEDSDDEEAEAMSAGTAAAAADMSIGGPPPPALGDPSGKVKA